MGRVKDLWMDELEAISGAYALGKLTHKQAAKRLHRLGFDWDEADDMLQASEASLSDKIHTVQS